MVTIWRENWRRCHAEVNTWPGTLPSAVEDFFLQILRENKETTFAIEF
jgi:hypothetical protein